MTCPAGFCPQCGFEHVRERRLAAMRRMLPCSADELREAHPCWWAGPKGSRGERQLYRDLHGVGAVKCGGLWGVPGRRAA